MHCVIRECRPKSLSVPLGLLLSVISTVQGAVSITGDVSPNPIPEGFNQALIVGDQADGTLLVDDGSRITSFSGYIGGYNGNTPSGTVTINGAGSVWDLDGGLGMSLYGDGTLNITHGGQVNAYSGALGASITGSTWNPATVRVDGPGSLLHFDNALYLHGQLDITSGASLVAGHAVLSPTYDSQSQTTLSGPGSSLSIHGGSLLVGWQGQGSLTVSNQASVTLDVGTTPSPDISTPSIAYGVVILDGHFADTPSTLLIESGGSIHSHHGSIIFGNDVTVRGNDSLWHIVGQLQVSHAGSTVNIQDGGEIVATDRVRLRLGGTINLAGGILSSPKVDIANNGVLNFTAGELITGAFLGDLHNQGGVFSPASDASESTVTGSYTQSADATLRMDINGPTLGSEYDRLSVTGMIDLNGTLSIDAGSYQPQIGDEFLILGSAIGISGVFNQIDLPSHFSLVYDTYDVTLITQIPGDLNGDGFVGIEDLNIILGKWNQQVAARDPQKGDPSGDGFVGIADLNLVLGNWNAGTPPGDTTNIPEPGTLSLLGLSGFIMIRRRRQPKASTTLTT